MKKKKITGRVLLTAVALLSSLIIIVPLLIVIFGSFKDAPEAQAFSLACRPVGTSRIILLLFRKEIWDGLF